jgi:hypothetical protein
VMIPWWGTMGAAIAMAMALVFESAVLFFLTKRRMGLHGFIWGGKSAPASQP